MYEKKFTVEEVIRDNQKYIESEAIARAKADFKEKGRGGDFRFSSLKAIVELLELNQRKLNQIERLLAEGNGGGQK